MDGMPWPAKLNGNGAGTDYRLSSVDGCGAEAPPRRLLVLGLAADDVIDLDLARRAGEAGPVLRLGEREGVALVEHRIGERRPAERRQVERAELGGVRAALEGDAADRARARAAAAVAVHGDGDVVGGRAGEGGVEADPEVLHPHRGMGGEDRDLLGRAAGRLAGE